MKTLRNTLRAKAQRGSVLLIGVLIISSLAALGLVVVFNAYEEVSSSGNYKTSMQGYYLGEAGLSSPLAQAAQNQEVFLSFLQHNGFMVRMGDIASPFWDSSSRGSFGPEYARDDGAVFVSYFSEPTDSTSIPGYSTSGFCFRKYTVTSDGFLGVDLVDPEDPKTITHSSIRRFVAHVYLGPFACGL
jgi:hypothetical protein